jgi:hypothetical protein
MVLDLDCKLKVVLLIILYICIDEIIVMRELK